MGNKDSFWKAGVLILPRNHLNVTNKFLPLTDATTKNRRITHNFQQTNQHSIPSHNQSHSFDNHNNNQSDKTRKRAYC